MRLYLTSFMLLAGTALAPTAHAQSQRGSVEGRVDRLESEMRAVQRKVFPGGAGNVQYVLPDNMPATPDPASPGTPSTSAVADLTTRVDALETQLRTMTGQIETEQHRLQLLEGRLRTLETNAAAMPAPAGSGVPYASGGVSSGDDPAPIERSAPPRATASRATSAHPTMGGDTPDTAIARPLATGKGSADPARAARLAAVEKPATGDAAEDGYLYGYRLWSAKLYPEAEAQFTAVTSKYPSHKRASYAQNLLGRSYLEDGKPSLASLAFYDNYKRWPDGDRAAESLYYLAQALVKLDKPASQVCKVYTELTRVYPAKVEADARMKAGIARGRADSKCT